MLDNLSWEDETRLTFIELSIFMDKVANPLDSIIDFAWASGADLFLVNNAKDELKRLRRELDLLKSSFDQPAAYAKVTDDGWMYDLNIKNNPYYDQTKVVPLYRINHG